MNAATRSAELDALLRKHDDSACSIRGTQRFGHILTEDLPDEEETYEDAFLDLCCCTTKDRTDRSCVTQLLSTAMGRLCLVLTLGVILYVFYLANSGSSQEVLPTPNTFNKSGVQTILDDLCHEFSNGKVSGNLCRSLCDFKNWSVIDFHQGASKKALRVSMNGQDVILKATKQYFRDYEQLEHTVDESELIDKIVDLVNDRMDLGWPHHYKNHLMNQLWSGYNPRKKGAQLSDADRASIWALLQQDEFITFSLASLSRVTTKVHGSCGHFYAVDTLLPFHMKGYYMGLKAKILVHLMGTLKLFYEFLNEPLQWCDVKFENLGLSAQYPKRFVIMDGDMLYTDSKLTEILTARPCTADKDCEYFDCHAQCNNGTGFCTSRVNDNVDVFCAKLVGRLFGKYWSKSNRYLAACHDTTSSRAKRLQDLMLVWSWSLSDV